MKTFGGANPPSFFRMKYIAPYERSDLNDNFIINGSYLRVYDY